ncbi:MAG: recombination mediator RecR [Bacteroidetes bacterium]|nr:recombination mediator RecR [Bacteroidota bacterium]MBU1114492.1 recombination mediator RecR [Bacteroidota bacterium]MBU1799908.1 recombination mediator RecR [Bacteroidota bacterium]
MIIPSTLQKAIDELSKLPSIGRKSAQRLALHILKSEIAEVQNLSKSILELKENTQICKKCFNISENEVCDICKSEKRDKSIICVVEEISDVIAIEKTNEFSGLYHVLGGVLSPLSGKDADSLNLKELISRVRAEKTAEVILALNPDTEGETTSLYIAKLLKSFDVKVSRLARGLPIGGDLEFADDATIGRAVLSRIQL